MMALLTMAYLGAALAGMSTYVAYQTNRTSSLVEQAQLRQSLLASARAAEMMLAQVQSGQAEISVPGERGKIRIALTVNGEHATAEIVASGRKLQARQTLTFSRHGTQWQMESAQIH